LKKEVYYRRPDVKKAELNRAKRKEDKLKWKGQKFERF
jgi:hypothetical protein